MNDEPGFDPVDDELGRRFRAGAPTDADPDVVLDTLRPRLQRARTRRRASIASAVAGAAAVVVAVVLVLGGGGGGAGSVRTPPASRGTQRSTPSVSTTAPSGGSATSDRAPDTIDDRGADEGARATSPTAPDATIPSEAPLTGAPQPVERSYSSSGGSVTVRLADGQVSLVSSSAAPGYAAEVHDNGPTRVEVRFSDGRTEWRVRVDVVDGQLVPEITQHG
jgi:hypothetical protein